MTASNSQKYIFGRIRCLPPWVSSPLWYFSLRATLSDGGSFPRDMPIAAFGQGKSVREAFDHLQDMIKQFDRELPSSFLQAMREQVRDSTLAKVDEFFRGVPPDDAEIYLNFFCELGDDEESKAFLCCVQDLD